MKLLARKQVEPVIVCVLQLMLACGCAAATVKGVVGVVACASVDAFTMHARHGALVCLVCALGGRGCRFGGGYQSCACAKYVLMSNESVGLATLLVVRAVCTACGTCAKRVYAVRAASMCVGAAMAYKVVTYLTRLETRTKESNMCASY